MTKLENIVNGIAKVIVVSIEFIAIVLALPIYFVYCFLCAIL